MNDWLRYANQSATRRLPLAPDLAAALEQFIPDMGLAVKVFSGGQPAAGQGPRVGSTRHDHGNAADVFFYRGDERLDWANPQHQPIFQDIVRRGREAGLTGFGAGPGYMQPGSMHIGFGNPGVWGAGGKAANAPRWLAEAFGGAGVGPTRANAARMSAASQSPAPFASDPAPVQPPPEIDINSLAGLFGGPAPVVPMGSTPAQRSAPQEAPATPAPAVAALSGDPGGVMSAIAMQFMQGQQQRQQRQRDYQTAEQQRRQSLSSMFG